MKNTLITAAIVLGTLAVWHMVAPASVKTITGTV
jgi:hypothetical protein